MKKELLNEVSRIKSMMKQLNENDFTDNSGEDVDESQEYIIKLINSPGAGLNIKRHLEGKKIKVYKYDIGGMSQFGIGVFYSNGSTNYTKNTTGLGLDPEEIVTVVDYLGERKLLCVGVNGDKWRVDINKNDNEEYSVHIVPEQTDNNNRD
jgi:hypothetical protein